MKCGKENPTICQNERGEITHYFTFNDSNATVQFKTCIQVHYASFSWGITHKFLRMQCLAAYTLDACRRQCRGDWVALLGQAGQGSLLRQSCLWAACTGAREPKYRLLRWKWTLSDFVSDTGVGTHEFQGNSSRMLQASSSEADVQVSAAMSFFNKPLHQNSLFKFV